jgi:hypothetical protein
MALAKRCTFNAEYYRHNMLAALTQLQPEDDGRKLVVRADNGRAHTVKNVELFAKKMDSAHSPSTLLT